MVRGIVRKLDDLGRITLPMEYRKTFGVEVGENAPAVMHLVGNVIHIELKPEKAIGLTRFLDELGRLTIPKEIRKSLSIEAHQEVDMYIENGAICIRKASLQCVLCGSEEEKELLEVDGVLICRECALKIADKLLRD